MKVENPRKKISEHKMELRVSSEVDFLLLKGFFFQIVLALHPLQYPASFHASHAKISHKI